MSIYQPSTDGTPVNRPLGVSNMPDGARSYYHDRENFLWRPYVSASEVFQTLDTEAKRKGHFLIVINTGGTIATGGVLEGGTDEFWYFKDGQEDEDLVKLIDLSSILSRLTALEVEVFNSNPSEGIGSMAIGSTFIIG